MKIADVKKFNKVVAAVLLISIIFSCFSAVSVYSADYKSGAVASFELIDESTGANVLGTILNRLESTDIASDQNPFICTRLYFSNVKVYIDDASTIDWGIYYWRVSSLDSAVAEVVGERITDGDKEPLPGDVYNGYYYLRIDALSVGTTVITVELSASASMSNSITKTFTVRVIDDSNDGEIFASFYIGENGAAIDLNQEISLKMTDTAEITVSSVSGYNYSNLNTNFEKTLASYSWTAEVVDKTGSAAVSASLAGDYYNTASASSEEISGGKILYIKPLREGEVDIKFTINPGEIHANRYKTSTQTIKLYISRVVGSLEFNASSEIYGGGTSYQNVGIRLEDFRIMINGENKDIAGLVNENNAILTAYITVPKNKMSSEIAVDDEYSQWETNPADMSEARCSVDMSGNFLKDPFIHLPLTDSAEVKIDIEGYVYNEYKSASKRTEIKFIGDSDNGKIASLSFMSGGETVYPGNVLEAETDKDGNAESIIILENFEASAYDSKNPSSGYKSPLDLRYYTIRAETKKTDTVSIENIVTDGENKIVIKPLKAGTAEIKVTAEILDGSSSFEVVFSVNSINVGMLPKDEGAVLNVELKRDDGKKIYTGENKIIYLQAGLGNYGAMTLNIDKVIATANNPETDYTGELKNFRWDIFQSYEGSYADMLTIGGILGDTDNGKAAIKIGTERIADETGKILITLKITPQIKEYTEDGEEVYRYDANKSFEVSFGVIVNGLGAKFIPEIDYADERIFLVTLKIGDDKGYYNFNGSPEYMYCLGAAKDGENQSAEQWVPFMGSSMDISSLIPNGGTTPFRIAIRDINAEAGEDGGYSDGSRKVIELYPRRTATADERKSIIYKDEKIIYDGLGSGAEYIFYKVGNGDYTRREITAGSGIDVPKTANPLGNTVTIKFAAKIDYENEENNRFASAEFKIKVPRTAKIPSIREIRAGKYGGFTNKTLWSATGETGSWENCAKGSVSYANLKFAFPDLKKDPDGKFYNLYLKNSATLKSAESNIMILKIPAERYER